MYISNLLIVPNLVYCFQYCNCYLVVWLTKSLKYCQGQDIFTPNNWHRLSNIFNILFYANRWVYEAGADTSRTFDAVFIKFIYGWVYKASATQVGHSTPYLSNLSSILPRMLRRTEVGPVKLGKAPNFVQEMMRIGQAFSEYNCMRRHQLKFGYGPKYPSLEVVVRPDEPGTAPNSYYKTLKTGTDTQTYLNKLSAENPTPNENKTNAFKVKQLTPHHNETTKLIVDDSAPNQTLVEIRPRVQM